MAEDLKDHYEAAEWLGREVYVGAYLLKSNGVSSVPYTEFSDAFMGMLGSDTEENRYFLIDEQGSETHSIEYVYEVADDTLPKGRRVLFIDGWLVRDDESRQWYRWIVEADQLTQS